jgi:hypothetical protein
VQVGAARERRFRRISSRRRKPRRRQTTYEGRLTSVSQGGTAIAGLGEKAIFTTGNLGGNFSDLDALTGRANLHLRHNANKGKGTVTQATLTELASKALERLKQSE